ncbi:hypothetical protein FE633_25360 [Streptomyces montanus]|uniref:Uncharacterized protein n=1 Tax=Streptomyces montanus TaxID=2580423 RepID=A0A5R9FPS2_9ACTN|nr:hypothetical protein [Streptomyces montanus]TLS43478.1 hypothetical protein FE633_25360 [Streptomyces montanus]
MSSRQLCSSPRREVPGDTLDMWLKGVGQAAESRSNEGLTGGVMAVIGNWMEPNRVSIRLFGDVRTTTAEVTEVQVQV